MPKLSLIPQNQIHMILHVGLAHSYPVRESLAMVGKIPWGTIWKNFLVLSSAWSNIPATASIFLIISGKRNYWCICHSSVFITDKCSSIPVYEDLKGDKDLKDDNCHLGEIPITEVKKN